MTDIIQTAYDEWLDMLSLAMSDAKIKDKLPRKPNDFWRWAFEALYEGSLLNAVNFAKAAGGEGFMAKECLRDMTKAELIGLILMEHITCSEHYDEAV